MPNTATNTEPDFYANAKDCGLCGDPDSTEVKCVTCKRYVCDWCMSHQSDEIECESCTDDNEEEE